MIEYLELQDVGPADHMRLDFAPRLNILTGDNGLGKTFVLDLAWWALTQTWVAEQAWPRVLGQGVPQVRSSWASSSDAARYTFGFAFEHVTQTWQQALYSAGGQRFVTVIGRTDAGRAGVGPRPESVVVYVRADQLYATWDEARNSGDPSASVTSPSYRFARDELWNGLSQKRDGPGRPSVLCNGLIRDWIRWQTANTEEFGVLTEVLAVLSPSPEERLQPGQPTRLRVNDAQDLPTLKLPYGEVPIALAAAGMARILDIAYLLVWAWSEHKRAAPLLGMAPADQLILLIDEVELHLHPEWQRRIVPALLRAAEVLRPDMEVQVLLTTHSPLVLASLEPLFEEDRDRLFSFQVAAEAVSVAQVAFAPQGGVDNWLTSMVFDLHRKPSV
ncbi:MAG: AAA family ATPase, partial [Armatimonadetes bacterium]|nr:AAA family ATPase [Armatimonadota bacterium]